MIKSQRQNERNKGDKLGKVRFKLGTQIFKEESVFLIVVISVISGNQYFVENIDHLPKTKLYQISRKIIIDEGNGTRNATQKVS